MTPHGQLQDRAHCEYNLTDNASQSIQWSPKWPNCCYENYHKLRWTFISSDTKVSHNLLTIIDQVLTNKHFQKYRLNFTDPFFIQPTYDYVRVVDGDNYRSSTICEYTVYQLSECISIEYQ